MSTLASLVVKLNGDISDYEQKMGRAGQITSGIGEEIATIGKVAAGAAAVGIGIVGAGFVKLTKDAIATNATLETSTLQFTTLMDSAEAAETHVASLFDFAKKTPFETQPIIDASRMMQTFGGEALNTMDNLTLIGDAAAATNAPIDELGFWVGRLFSQLKGGQPFGEAAMRLQELAVMSPEARTQMEELQKAGASADDIFNVFQEDLGKFTGAMETQAGTWQGLTSTISDAFSLLAADALAPFFDTAKLAAGALAEFLGSEEVSAKATEIATSISAITTAVFNFVDRVMQGMDWITALSFALLSLGVPPERIEQIRLFAEKLQEFIDKIAEFVSYKDILIALGIAVAIALAPIILAAIKLALLFALLVAVVAALRRAWETDFAGIRAFVMAVWTAVQLFISGIKKLFSGDTQGALEDFRTAFETAFNAVLTFLGNLASEIGPKLAEWWNAFVTWVQETDWLKLGQDIVNFVLDGLTKFVEWIGPKLEEWWGEFTAWVERTDWEKIGTDIVNFVLDGLANFVQWVTDKLTEWENAFWDWFDDVDWEQLGKDMVTTVIDGLKSFAEDAGPTLDDWYNKFVTWVSEVDWAAIADDIADGIIAGLQKLVEIGSKLWNAAMDVARGIMDAIKEELGIASPSKAMMALGPDMMTGLAIGIRDNADKPADAMADVANQISTDGAVAFAEAITAVVDAIMPAIDVLTQLMGMQVPEVRGRIIEWREQIQALVDNFAVGAYLLLESSGGHALNLAQDMAAAVEGATGAIMAAIEALSALETFVIPEGVNDVLLALVDSIGVLVAALVEVAAKMEQEALGHAQVFADAADALIGLVTPAIDAIVAIPEYVRSVDFGNRVSVFVNDLTVVIETLANAFDRFLGPIRDAVISAGELAQAGGAIVSILGPALEVVGGMTDYVRAEAFGDKVRTFAEDLTVIIQTLATAFRIHLSPMADAVAAAGAFAEHINAIVSVVKPGLEIIGAFADYVRAENLSIKVSQFASQIADVARFLAVIFDNALRGIGENMLTNAATFVANVEEALRGVMAIIDLIGQLVTADAPGTLQGALDQMLQAFRNKKVPAYQAGWMVGQRYIDGIVDAITAGLARVNEAMAIVAPPPPAPVPATAANSASSAGTRITIEAGAFQTTISNEMDAQEFEYRMLEVLRRLTEAA